MLLERNSSLSRITPTSVGNPFLFAICVQYPRVFIAVFIAFSPMSLNSGARRGICFQGICRREGDARSYASSSFLRGGRKPRHSSTPLLLLRGNSMAISVLYLSICNMELFPNFTPRDLKQECSLNCNALVACCIKRGSWYLRQLVSFRFS